MLKMSGNYIGKKDFLNKRIPDNPRYKHVKPVVDSGSSVTKYLEHLEEMRKNYKYKKDEIFRRIKSTTFAQLVLQVADALLLEGELATPQPTVVTPPTLPQHTPSPVHEGTSSATTPPHSTRPTLSDLISGVGELDVSNPDTSPSPSHVCTPSPTRCPPLSPSNCPYLLLDVRETEEYDKCHIVSAINYPARLLSRSVNPYIKELFEYKSKPGCIIIVYDDNEQIAPEVATKLVQRDFNNVFMLSGGLKILNKKFPKGLITGVVPPSCLPSPPASSSRRRSSLAASKVEKPNGELKTFFDQEDLLVVQQKLDELLLSSPSTCSSRASNCSRSSVSSVRTAKTNASSVKPWK